MNTERSIKGHKLIAVGMPGAGLWRCECGQWESKTPAVGPYGKTTMRARIAQLNMAHMKHADFATCPRAAVRRRGEQ